MKQGPKLSDLYHSLVNDITQNVEQLPYLTLLSTKISRKPGQIFLISMVITTILTSLGLIGHYFTVFVAVSLVLSRTLQMERQANRDERVRLTTYWMTLGGVIALDFVLGSFLGSLPFYDLAKLLLVVSMAYPKTDLTLKLYHNLIEARFLIPKPQPSRL